MRQSLKGLRRIFDRVQDTLAPEPGFHDVEDMANRGIGIMFMASHNPWVDGGEQPETPLVGDVVIALESCSMGVTVRRDRRWRVTGSGERFVYDGSAGRMMTQVMLVDEQGKEGSMLVAPLRRVNGRRRTWMVVD